MTIKEALKKWKISEKTLLKMLSEGKVAGLKTENNILILPDFPNVFCVPQNAKRSDGNIYKYILSAVSRGCFLDASLLGEKFALSDSDFNDYIGKLESCGLIKRRNNCTDGFSTLNYFVAPDKLSDVDKMINYKGERIIKILTKIKPDINIGCIVL